MWGVLCSAPTPPMGKPDVTIVGLGSLLSERSSRTTFPNLANFRLARSTATGGCTCLRDATTRWLLHRWLSQLHVAQQTSTRACNKQSFRHSDTRAERRSEIRWLPSQMVLSLRANRIGCTTWHCLIRPRGLSCPCHSVAGSVGPTPAFWRVHEAHDSSIPNDPHDTNFLSPLSSTTFDFFLYCKGMCCSSIVKNKG